MSKFEGVDPIIMGFEIVLQDKRYVTTEGLLYLMGDQYKKYSVRPELPTVEEVMQIRQMMGLDTGDPLVVIRGVVETDRGTFVDYGTTSPKNLKGFVKFSDYPLEMACRRATNRAMRIATGAGTSIDEIDTEVRPNQQETQAEDVDNYAVVDDKIPNEQVEGGLAKAEEQPMPEPDGKWNYNKKTKEILLTGNFPSDDYLKKALSNYVLNVLFVVKDRSVAETLLAREVMETNLDMLCTTLPDGEMDPLTERFTALKLHTVGEAQAEKKTQ